MFSPRPCFATLSKSITPRKPDSRARSPVISGRPIGVIESISISPSSIRYRLPTLTCRRFQIRTLHVIFPLRTSSRRRFVKVMNAELVEQVFLPLVVALGEQTHQVAAGMQAEGPGRAGELHAGLLGRAAALAVVARMAARDEILPGGLAGARARNYVVERQLRGRHRPMAVLAGVAVAHQNVLAR